jgi:two-component system response regulator HydG
MAVHSTRLLLIGAPGSAFRLAAEMARGAGATVVMADTPADALPILRGDGAGLVMIDVATDVQGFMTMLRRERFAVPVLACGIDASAQRAVAAIHAGAQDYIPLPPERELIAAALASTVLQRVDRVIGDDPVFRRTVAFGLAVAPSRAPLLITGEGGCGKEAVARAIHTASGRSGRFVSVACSGVAADILDSELFGHEAGAFAGATARRCGQVEAAADGTLFLRDIAALPPLAQARLAQMLANGAVARIGGNAAVPVTARVIASTGTDLAARVAEGSFRADLHARLQLIEVALPPLRQRRQDISLLAAGFAERCALANSLPPRPLSPEALALLGDYGWPGNVRELEDVIHRALLLATGAQITPDDIVLIDGSRISTISQGAGRLHLEVEALIGRTVEEVERALILRTLERCRGNRTSASNILGISVRTMRNKLKSFIEAGIPVAPAL